jgi:O-methyltransferase
MKTTTEDRLWALRGAVPRWRERAVRPLIRNRFMHFPTFDRDVHESVTDHVDYFRYATLGLAVERLRTEGIEGSMAEVGVWRGETSEFVHSIAPERKLYLFDTFEGFPDGERTGDERFRDTSAEAVAARLGDSPNVAIRKGYVPDTFAGLEDERFAFALIDLDLHEPTVASLEFLYPRLVPGGYLSVHDYNSPESDWACKRALDEFLADKPERVVEIADMWGSALLRKA